MIQRQRSPLFFLVFLLSAVFLPAQDDPRSFPDGTHFNDGANFRDGTDFPVLSGEPPDYPLAGEERKTPEEAETPQAPEETEKKKFRVNNRMVELSIANVGFGFSNNFIAAADVIRNPSYLLRNINDIAKDPGLLWQDPIVVDLDRFLGGFKFSFGGNVKPLSINFNWKDKWGFGLDLAHVDITGNTSLSGNMVTLSEAREEEFGVGGAVFVDVGIPVFFHLRDFKIKIRPAAYVPLIYTEPKVTYSYYETAAGTYFKLSYDMQIYSLVSLKGIDEDMGAVVQRLADNASEIPRNNMGYDFRLNVEYPWLYNLNVGLDMVNIPFPFAAARLNHYMHLNGSVWADTRNLNIEGLVDGSIDPDNLKGTVYDYPDGFDPEYKYNADGKKIYRPFAMVFYAHYRPLPSPFLTLIPSLGFSINRLYPKVGAVEGGLSARFDLVNMFIATLGINYNDRKWINSMDFILNLRAFELDLGLSFSSQSFARSWQGAGLGINLGLKFGW